MKPVSKKDVRKLNDELRQRYLRLKKEIHELETLFDNLVGTVRKIEETHVNVVMFDAYKLAGTFTHITGDEFDDKLYDMDKMVYKLYRYAERLVKQILEKLEEREGV